MYVCVRVCVHVGKDKEAQNMPFHFFYRSRRFKRMNNATSQVKLKRVVRKRIQAGSRADMDIFFSTVR